MARINRKLFAGIIGAALMVVTLGTVSAGATAPGHYGYGYNYYGGVIGGTTYFDPRYCGNGLVSIVPEPSNGAPINICTSTGQRIFPVFPDYVPYGGFYGNRVVYNPVVYNPVAYRPYTCYR